jgi:hypothetical protein
MNERFRDLLIGPAWKQRVAGPAPAEEAITPEEPESLIGTSLH